MGRHSQAFTLIELLVVVAIIGILAAVGVVAYNGYTGAAKKAVVKANHKLILKTMLNEFKKCELDSSSGILNMNGKNLIDCSDIINSTSTKSNYGKMRVGMKTYFDDKIENLYVPNRSAFISGRYQGSCSPPDAKSYQGLNEQGVHHVAMGWVGNKITFYIDTCIETSGKAISETFNVRE
jgi:prepilin-type N-terminal cleavage/methylation domain-containing protein